MTLSFVEVFAAERQSPANQDYFAIRALQCFSPTTGPPGLDIWIASAPPVESPNPQLLVDKDNAKSHAPMSGAPSMHVYSSKIENEDEFQRLVESHRDATLKAFFIRQRNTVSRLSVSWQLFDHVCQSCGISAKIRDYVMCFGIRNGESETTPPAMHYRLARPDHSLRPVIFECIYILRFVEPNNRTYGNPWSIRQSGVYNSLNREKSSVVWLFISLSSMAEDELQRWRANASNLPDTRPFDIHYMLFDIAVSGWRRYIAYLADEIRQQADRAVVADFETDGLVVTRLEERQYLKQIDDHVTDLLSALQFMLENIETIMRCYETVTGKPTKEGILDPDPIPKAFHDRRRDLLRFTSQAQALRRKVDSASNLVSNILDLNNGNALKALALESRAENANMALMTKKSVQDAATVKVLTIITLVYLPVTVVTNVFSTQFMSTTEGVNGVSHLTVTPQIWILFAVSVPLTIATICIWWIFAQKDIKGKFPVGWRRAGEKPKSAYDSLGQPIDTAMIDLRRARPSESIS